MDCTHVLCCKLFSRIELQNARDFVLQSNICAIPHPLDRYCGSDFMEQGKRLTDTESFCFDWDIMENLNHGTMGAVTWLYSMIFNKIIPFISLLQFLTAVMKRDFEEARDLCDQSMLVLV